MAIIEFVSAGDTGHKKTRGRAKSKPAAKAPEKAVDETPPNEPEGEVSAAEEPEAAAEEKKAE
jgi:hypothetical protein